MTGSLGDGPHFYAGIGSRKTPPRVTTYMTMLAGCYLGLGWVLRSGRSGNADLAFERGAGAAAQLFEPWADFHLTAPPAHRLAEVHRQPSAGAERIAQAFHPRWDRCDRTARSLLARNAHVILGPNLNEPARHVVAWTPDGTIDGLGVTGGTAHALRIAAAHHCEVFNLARPADVAKLDKMMWVSNGPIEP
jgi:hypothetical protein